MYDIRTYNFREDEEFQAFLQEGLEGKFLPRQKFMALLGRYKRQYIQRLNSSHNLRVVPNRIAPEK